MGIRGVLVRCVLALALATAGMAGGLTPASAAVHVDDQAAASWRVDGRVYATLIVGDRVYVGGQFSTATSPSGQTAARSNLAAFDLRDGSLLPLRVDPNRVVRALASDGTSLWVGGSFWRIDGRSRARVAKVDLSSGSVDLAFDARVSGGLVRALALDGSGDLFVGGHFTTVAGESRPRLVKLRASDGRLDPQFAAGPGGNVYALAVDARSSSSPLYVGGAFSTLGGVSRSGIGAVDRNTGALVGPAFASSVNPTLDLDLSDDGSLLFAAGAAYHNSAQAWRTDSGRRLWRQTAEGDVQAVHYRDGTLYFGFHEGFQDDFSVRVLAADALSGAIDPAFRPSVNRFWGVWDIDSSPLAVVIGGEFSWVSGIAAEGWARFPALAGSAEEPPTEEPPAEEPPAGGPPVTTEPVGPATTWRYLDTGVRPAGWSGPGFDDRAWGSGRPQLGYGDGDEATVVDSGASTGSRHLTVYFRTSFDLAGVPESGEVRLLADDGAAVYLNGVEVVRDNLPAGPLTNDTQASSARWGAAEREFRVFSIDAGALRGGANTIAVEVHQSSRGSSDLSFDLSLSVITR